MENIKSNLKGLVGSVVTGIPINELESEYYDLTQSTLNYKDFGFKNLRNFLENISDVVEIIDKNGHSIVKMTISDDDPKSLQRLCDLVRCTKSKKKIIPNLVPKKNLNHESSRGSLADFTISVNNDHYQRDLRSPERRVRVDVTNIHRFMSSKPFHQSAYKSPIKSIRYHSPIKTQRRSTVVTLPLDNLSITYDTRSGDAPLNNGVCKENGVNETRDNKPKTAPVHNFGCWFVKPEHNFDALHTEVRIVGIQSGHAVIVDAATKPPNAFLELKNITTVYPGDLVFWQPPFIDPERAPTTVDVNSAFPAIVIRRIDMKKVQVRIMGLVMLLEVSIVDLHEMPTTSKDLSRTIARIECRHVTIVKLAYVPLSVHIWQADLYPDTYTVMFSLDGGTKVLEHTSRAGHFINLSLLDHVHGQLLLSGTIDDKRAFFQHVSGCIDRSMAALRPNFDKLLSDHDHSHPDNDALRLVYSLEECRDQVLLVSKKILASSSIMTSGNGHCGSSMTTDSAVLHRMKYWDNKAAFYSYDDKSDDVIVDGPLPVTGMYIVNQEFTDSWLGHRDDPLRFRTAVITGMPALVELALSLGLHDD